MQYLLYREIASIVDARRRVLERFKATGIDDGNWFDKHSQALEYIERNLLPSGSGIDSGTTIDLDASHGDKLVLKTSYHHMNDGGYYDGWTEHLIVVRPSLIHTIDIRIGGRDRNEIKDYIHGVFHSTLMIELTEDQRKQMYWLGVTA